MAKRPSATINENAMMKICHLGVYLCRCSLGADCETQPFYTMFRDGALSPKSKAVGLLGRLRILLDSHEPTVLVNASRRRSRGILAGQTLN